MKTPIKLSISTVGVVQLAVAAIALLSFAGGLRAEDPKPSIGAKEIFFARSGGGGGRVVHLDGPSAGLGQGIERASDGSGTTAMGLRYWIELKGAAEGEPAQRVTESRIFRDGERIRIHVDGNRDGYISVLQVGASGEPRLLFPKTGVVGKLVEVGETTTLPGSSSWFRFDQQKGVERIFLVFSPSEKTLESTVASTRTMVADARPSRDIVRFAGAKDLMVEVEQDLEQERGTYIASPAGEAIVFEIRLSHQ